MHIRILIKLLLSTLRILTSTAFQHLRVMKPLMVLTITYGISELTTIFLSTNLIQDLKKVWTEAVERAKTVELVLWDK